MSWIALIAVAILGALVLGAIGLWVWKPWVPPLRMAEPGETGRPVAEPGLIANFYPGTDGGRRPGIIVLGGSEGGLGTDAKSMALSLQEAGFAVLHLSYYRAPDQPANLELVPLEIFDRGLDWLGNQPDVAPGGIGIVGVSKGAEAALLVASRRSEIGAVAVGAPSSVVWTGINWNSGGAGKKSSWTVDGKPLPALPYGPFDWRVGMLSIYQGALKKLNEHPEAVIPVRQITAPILLVCGENDKLWPSCPMARQIENRTNTQGASSTTVLSYKDAGHHSFGAPVPNDHPDHARLAKLGGTLDGNTAARQDAWPKVIAFLKMHLPSPVGR